LDGSSAVGNGFTKRWVCSTSIACRTGLSEQLERPRLSIGSAARRYLNEFVRREISGVKLLLAFTRGSPVLQLAFKL